MQISVTIKPGSKHREEVAVGNDGDIVVYTKAPAVEGKANQAAIKLIAAHYGVSKTSVQLVRGHTSKYKLFEIAHSTPRKRK